MKDRVTQTDQNAGYSEEEEEKDKRGETDEGQQVTIHDKTEISLVLFS